MKSGGKGEPALQSKQRVGAFLMAFVLAAGALSVMGMAAFLFVKPLEDPDLDRPPEAGPGILLPSEQDGMNLLLILEDDLSPQPQPPALLLLRADPRTGSFPVACLPARTLVVPARPGSSATTPQAGQVSLSSSLTLEELYQARGISGLRTALERVWEIPVDRYLRIPLSRLEPLYAAVGSIDFQVPMDLSYRQGDITVQLSQGYQRMDGRKVLCLACSNGFASQEERCATLAQLVQQTVNQHLALAASPQAEEVFLAVVNLADTDLSSVDYAEHSRAFAFLAGLAQNPAWVLEVPLELDPATESFSLPQESAAQLRGAFHGTPS